MAVWMSCAELFPNLSYYLNVKSQSKMQSYMNHLVCQLKVYTGIHYVWVSQHSVFNAQEQPHGRSDFIYFVGLKGCVIVSIGCFHFHLHLTVSLIQLHMDTVAESQGCVGK